MRVPVVRNQRQAPRLDQIGPSEICRIAAFTTPTLRVVSASIANTCSPREKPFPLRAHTLTNSPRNVNHISPGKVDGIRVFSINPARSCNDRIHARGRGPDPPILRRGSQTTGSGDSRTEYVRTAYGWTTNCFTISYPNVGGVRKLLGG